MLDKLKEYKELITIIVFFLGGFTWLNAQFPTKADLESAKIDLKSAISYQDCLGERYMKLVQSQIDRQEIQVQVQGLDREIKEGSDDIEKSKVYISPAMQHSFDQHKHYPAHSLAHQLPRFPYRHTNHPVPFPRSQDC